MSYLKIIILSFCLLLIGACTNAITTHEDHFWCSDKNKTPLLHIRVWEQGDILKIILLSNDVFYPGSSKLRSYVDPALQKVAQMLLKRPNVQTVVTVYTDELGRYHAQTQLSQQRAERIIAALWQKGVSEQMLHPAVVTGADFVASNRNFAVSISNNRIELVQNSLQQDCDRCAHS